MTEYKEAFSLFDKKGDGSIDPSALGELLRSCGQNPTSTELTELSGDGSPISFDRFVADILNRNDGQGFKPHGTIEEFIQGFQVFDKDGNGIISSGELRYVLTSLGEKLTDAEVDELLKCVEVDKNGFVNYENFVRVIMS